MPHHAMPHLRSVLVLLLITTLVTACGRAPGAAEEARPTLRVRGLSQAHTARLTLVHPSGHVRPVRDGADLRGLRGTVRARSVRNGARVLLPDPARTTVDGARDVVVRYRTVRRTAAGTAEVPDAGPISGRTTAHGVVWRDVDGDSGFSSGGGDHALPGVPVLYDLDGDGSADPGEPRTRTGATGTYVLHDLDPTARYAPVIMGDGAPDAGAVRHRAW